MPRVYVKKRQTRYGLADLQKAVRDVENNKKTYRQAEEAYHVPVSVIYHRIKGRKIDINKMGAGVSKVLPGRVEEHISSCLKTRAQMGHPVMKEELKNLVKVYVEENGIANPFKDNKPGDDWYISFMKRHPELSFKRPEHLQKARMDARKPYIIYDFYDQLKSIVCQNNLDDKPMYVYNCDESGFQSDPSKLRAIGQKGKPLYRVSGGSGRESTTVLACVSADGQVFPPLVVFKGAAVQARWTSEKALPGTLYAASKNGWMEEPVFFNWFTKSFIPHVSRLREERKEPEQKALLLYDGHASHISVRIIEEADKGNIILMKFPSHLTDKIQPLDKCVFGPVKKAWEKKLVEYGIQQMGKGSGRLSREHFGELLGEVYTISFNPVNVISGFTSTGLHPVDPSKFPKSLFKPDDMKLYTVLLNNDQRCKNIEEDVALCQQEEEQLYLERCQRDNLVDKSFQMELVRQKKHEDIQQIETEKNEEEQIKVQQIRSPENSIEGNTIQAEMMDIQYEEDIQMTQEYIPQEDITQQIETDEVQIQTTQVYMPQEEITQQITDEVAIQQMEIEKADQQDVQESIQTQTKEIHNATKTIKQKRNMENTGKQPYKPQKITSNTTLNSGLSSSLLNNILKQISLDTETHPEIKTEIVNALLSTVKDKENEAEDNISPGKDALQKIFGVYCTPVKNNKIVIPRLKQCAFGEVLTSDEVKQRLKEAEDKKKPNNKSQTKQQCKTKLNDITNMKKIATEKNKQRKRKRNKNIIQAKKKRIVLTSKQKRKVDSDDSSNSEIEMSNHSDSDIAEIVTDETQDDYDYDYEQCPSQSRASPIAGCSRVDNEKIDFAEYKENDTVLVRYILKKKVEYYVGKVLNKIDNMTYKVSFYKKVGRSDNTRFLVNNKDIDTIPSSMIVKNVNLLSLNEKYTEFIFLDDDDFLYFN